MDLDMETHQHQHTCLTCAVAFTTGDLQRDHYKTDWHRYNLKRKVAEMGPVTLESFEEKMKSHAEQMKLLTGEVKEPTGYCPPCRKNFTTMKAYDNHVNSKKHKDTKAKFDLKTNKIEIENNRLNRKPTDDDDDTTLADDESVVEEVDSDEWEEDNMIEGDPILAEDCLFCPHHSRDLEKKMVHMTEKHGFFIPDMEYIKDLEGLIEYLGEKVGAGFMCLWCNERSKHFQTLTAVQNHMTDKNHCKLKHDDGVFVEYASFYDYTTSYPEGQRPVDDDEEVDITGIDDTGFELTLPSGAKVGHRSLLRYYKQSLNPERQISTQRSAHNKVLSHYRSLGWGGLSKPEAKQKARDIKHMHKVQQKHWQKLGTGANKLQKYFRDPTMIFG